MADVIRLRPSSVLKHDECPAQYYFSAVEGLRSKVTSANLPFGTAVHEAMTGYILSKISGKPFNPVEAFEAEWDRAIENEILGFSSIWDEPSMRATGKLLSERFPEAWDRTGLTPVLDGDGPVVERRFQATIAPGVVLTGQPDVVAMNSDGEVIVVDVKTTASAYDPTFVLVAEQLTAYQILLEANRESLGIESVDKLGFIEAVKKKVPKTNRGTGPEVKEPLLAPSRDGAMTREYLSKVEDMARDIKRERFPRRPRMAFNSPCNMCDFRDYCLKGDMEGLYRPRDESPSSDDSSVSIAV
mgnify:CR=1 FL=1